MFDVLRLHLAGARAYWRRVLDRALTVALVVLGLIVLLLAGGVGLGLLAVNVPMQ